jgi:hypothetical protein
MLKNYPDIPFFPKAAQNIGETIQEDILLYTANKYISQII